MSCLGAVLDHLQSEIEMRCDPQHECIYVCCLYLAVAVVLERHEVVGLAVLGVHVLLGLQAFLLDQAGRLQGTPISQRVGDASRQVLQTHVSAEEVVLVLVRARRLHRRVRRGRGENLVFPAVALCEGDSVFFRVEGQL